MKRKKEKRVRSGYQDGDYALLADAIMNPTKKSKPKPNGQYVGWTWNQQHFFMGCKNRAAVSDFIVSIAAGQLLTANNIPTDLLPCALLLHCVAPEPGIVDDTLMLTTMIEEEYQSKDHGARFWHPEGFLVSRISSGLSDSSAVEELPDTQYIVQVYEELTNDAKREALFGWLPRTAGNKASKKK